MTPNLRAFLDVIAMCEVGTLDDIGYRALFGFHPKNNPGKVFSSFADHPRQAFQSSWGWTSAAGRYQAMCAVPGKVKTDTWGDFIRQEGAHDFSPDSQDLFARWAIARRKALADVEAGRIEDAITKCALEWASLPGSPYGQPTRSLEYCLNVYRARGGSLAGARPGGAPSPNLPTMGTPIQKEGSRMDPFTGVAISKIVQMIPSLLGVLGGEKAEKNAKAAELVVNAFTANVPGAANPQDAIQKAEADPSVKAAAVAAVEANPFVMSLVEVGGGIAAARKAADDYMSRTEDDEWWRMLLKIPANPTLLISGAVLFIVYLFVVPLAATISDLSAEVRAAIIMSIVGGLGTVLAFWFGTMQRQNDQ